jgi:hypothetical protein
MKLGRMNSPKRERQQQTTRNLRRLEILTKLRAGKLTTKSLGVLHPLKLAGLLTYEMDGELIRAGSVKITNFGTAFLKYHKK